MLPAPAFVSLSICWCSLHAHVSASHPYPHSPFCFSFFVYLLLFFLFFFLCFSSSSAAIDLVRDDSSAGASAAGQVISEHLPLLHQRLQTLLQAGRWQELEAMAHTLAFVGGLLPPALQEGISRKALEACQNADTQVRAKDMLLHTFSARCCVANVLAHVITNALPWALLTDMHACFHAIRQRSVSALTKHYHRQRQSIDQFTLPVFSTHHRSQQTTTQKILQMLKQVIQCCFGPQNDLKSTYTSSSPQKKTDRVCTCVQVMHAGASKALISLHLSTAGTKLYLPHATTHRISSRCKHMPMCLSFCLTQCLFVCLFVHLYVCLSVHVFGCPSVRL